jgi:hypothetical protein
MYFLKSFIFKIPKDLRSTFITGFARDENRSHNFTICWPVAEIGYQMTIKSGVKG